MVINMKKTKSIKHLLLLVAGILIVAFVGYIVWGNVEKKTTEQKYFNSEDGIFQAFNENSELFSEVADYLENDPENFYLDKTESKLCIQLDSEDIDINSYPIGKQIMYIVNKLNFVGIYEDDTSIKFLKKAGVEEKGIIYCKKDKAIKVYDHMPVGKVVSIKDNWYYYYQHHE